MLFLTKVKSNNDGELFSLTSFIVIYIHNIFHGINTIEKYSEKVIEASLDLSFM